MLPVKHLPQRMVFKQSGIVKIPLIDEKDVHCIRRYQREKPDSKNDENETNKNISQNESITPGDDRESADETLGCGFSRAASLSRPYLLSEPPVSSTKCAR